MWEAEAEVCHLSLRVQDQSGQHSETQSQIRTTASAPTQTLGGTTLTRESGVQRAGLQSCSCHVLAHVAITFLLYPPPMEKYINHSAVSQTQTNAT